MNKTLSVNIGGMAFKIDEIAFQKLKNYLDSVKSRFQDAREQEEIVSDIESRIAEIFSERISDSKEVIVMDDVNHMIGIMGEPNDIGGMDEEADNLGYSTTGKRRLFRNPDDKVLAGVASGLSAYFGISDPIWLRLIFVILTLVGVGFLIPIYILLWIIIPEAKNTAEKLQMRGEEANISNIEKSFRDGMENLETSLKDLGSKKKIREAGNFFERIVGALISIIRLSFLFVVKLIALILIMIGAVLFVSLIVALVTSSAFIFPPLSSLVSLVVSSGLTLFLGVLGALLVIGIPTLALIYLGIRILLGKSAHIRGFGLGMLGFWIVGVILSGIVGVNIGKNFRERAKVTEPLSITQPAAELLQIDIIDFDQSPYYENSEVIEYDNFDIDGLFMTEDGIYLDELQFYVEKSKNDQFSLVQSSSASGSSNINAKELAQKLKIGVAQTDSTLNVDGFFKLSKDNKYRNQKVKLTLKVPVGKSIRFSTTSYSFIRNFTTVSEDRVYDVTGKIWTMTEEGLKCMDCTRDDLDGFDSGDYPKRIYEFKDFSALHITGMYRLSIEKGEEYEVSLQGRERDIDRVKVSMDGDELKLKSKQISLSKKAVTVSITMPELQQLELAGASEVYIEGFNQEEIDIEMGGANDVRLNDIQTIRFNLSAAGKNKISIDGTTDYFAVEAAGESELKAFDFISKNVDVSMVGKVDAEVHATGVLNADLAGSCKLRYKGDAMIDSDEFGFADVEKVD